MGHPTDLSGNVVSIGPAIEISTRLDPWDEDAMSDLFGKAGPKAADLLIAFDQFRATRDSFGVDAERFVQFIVPKLQAFKEAAQLAYEDSL